MRRQTWIERPIYANNGLRRYHHKQLVQNHTHGSDATDRVEICRTRQN